MTQNYLYFFTKKQEILENYKKVLQRYALKHEDLKDILFEIINRLANDEKFYQKYIEKMKEKIEKGEVVNSKAVLLELFFS